MKKLFLFLFIVCLSSIAFSQDVNVLSQGQNSIVSQSKINEGDCDRETEIFLNDLREDKEESKREFLNSMQSFNLIIDGVEKLTEDGRKEIKVIAYKENRNLLVTSIFLWISITIFIIMNLVFANNLKKELYFLRNGLLRSEIKDNMISLSEQLVAMNRKLDSLNNKNSNNL